MTLLTLRNNMKKIYFVRHGETQSNIDRSFQDPEELLNERGLAQAEILAKRIKSLRIDKIIASTMPRAMQTADAIIKENNMTYETSDLFREIKPVSSIVGAPHSDNPESLLVKYKRARELHAGDDSWHFEDEENPADFLKRIKDSLLHLASLPDEKILVVTHGMYLRCCVGYIINAGRCKPVDLLTFKDTLKMTNAGITVVDYKEKNWVLTTWNDYAHFAE